MQHIDNIDPNTIDNDPRIIIKFEEYLEDIQRSWFLYLLKDGDHLIWASKGTTSARNGNPPKLLGGNILEFPIKGLPWFITTLEQRFFKTEAEGGLPKGKFAHEEFVDGEHLCVSRMFGEPGYGFRNYSRQDHVITTYKNPQQTDFSDELLFKKGLFDELKKIALKIEGGDL